VARSLPCQNEKCGKIIQNLCLCHKAPGPRRVVLTPAILSGVGGGGRSRGRVRAGARFLISGIWCVKLITYLVREVGFGYLVREVDKRIQLILSLLFTV
jgi:hypothetical protein